MVIWAQSEHFESTFFLLFLPLFQSLLPPVLYFARVTCPHTLYVCGCLWISKDLKQYSVNWTHEAPYFIRKICQAISLQPRKSKSWSLLDKGDEKTIEGIHIPCN